MLIQDLNPLKCRQSLHYYGTESEEVPQNRDSDFQHFNSILEQ